MAKTKRKRRAPRLKKNVELSQLPPAAEKLSRHWSELERLRAEVYQRLMPSIMADYFAAACRKEPKPGEIATILLRADDEWSDATGLPPLTLDNFEVVMAHVSAEGYPATPAGLIAWTIAAQQAIRAKQGRAEYFVNTRQIATFCGCTKTTIERYRKSGKIPPPDVKGKDGAAYQWKWSAVRSHLERAFARKMPVIFPSDPFPNAEDLE